MADEALAGLDEGALRKLVSSPMTVLWGGEEPSQGYRATAFALFSAYKQGGFGGEVTETAPSWFHLTDPQALVACACLSMSSAETWSLPTPNCHLLFKQ